MLLCVFLYNLWYSQTIQGFDQSLWAVQLRAVGWIIVCDCAGRWKRKYVKKFETTLFIATAQIIRWIWYGSQSFCLTLINLIALQIGVHSYFYCRQFSMMVDTCFDTCHCFVYAQPRYLSASRIYWSDGHDFRLGPTGMCACNVRSAKPLYIPFVMTVIILYPQVLMTSFLRDMHSWCKWTWRLMQ